MEYQYNDGGRKAAGYKGSTGDCVARAVAIASGKPYQEVYNFLANGNATQRITKRSNASDAGVKTARNGISVKRKWFSDYMHSLGFEYEAYASIGKPSKVKLDDSFPKDGVYIAQIGKHYVSVLNGVVNDTYDSRMGGEYFDAYGVLQPAKARMVYGVWKKVGNPSQIQPKPQPKPKAKKASPALEDMTKAELIALVRSLQRTGKR